MLAIWGMETNFGKNRGSIPVIESLATLAYDGRRRGFAEEQLIAALRILQSGDVTPAGMRGSWAGAMGHTQFIPTSYQSYAVDFTGDGRRDVWSDDPSDALASAANYLARSGWQHGQPWGIEVRVPQGFNYGSADQSNIRPVGDWRARGVTALDGSPLPDHGQAAIIAPAGSRGPSFAVYHNFFVIKKYNNATSYAMGVGHLGDRIMGAGPFVGAWPRGERELSRTEKIELQQRLIAPRPRHRLDRRGDRPEHHHRDPRLPAARGADAGRLRRCLAAGAAPLMAEGTRKLAVLIDADNTSPRIAEGLFDEVAKIGEASLRRIYGDFSKGQLVGWEKVLARYAILAQQQFAYTTGKNSTDITLVIDAMDLLHSGRFDGFCLVSSDSDFTRLAARIREQGTDVYGIGQAKTPESFRQACTRFIFSENFVPDTDGPTVVKTALKPMTEAAGLIDKALEQMEEDSEGWFQLGAVGQRLQNLSSEFDTRTFGHSKLSDLVTATGRYDIDRTGPHVRLRPRKTRRGRGA